MLFLIKLVTIFGIPKLWITIVELTILVTWRKLHCRFHIIPRKHTYWTDLVLRHQCLVAVDTILYWWCECRHCFLLIVVGFNTLLAESLRRERGITLPSSSSFDLPNIQRFGWVRQVSYWINQFYLRTHILEFHWLFLHPRSITIKDLTFSFRKIGKCTQTWDGFCFGLNHVLGRFYLRERTPNPVSVTRSSWKDKEIGFE